MFDVMSVDGLLSIVAKERIDGINTVQFPRVDRRAGPV